MSDVYNNDYVKQLTKEEIDKLGLKGQIYVITNTKKTSYNKYHGQTRTHYRLGDGWVETGYVRRFQSHINEAMQGKDDTKLNRAIRKYGAEAFIVELVEECECTLEVLDAREIYYIALFDTFNNGYNTTPGGRTKAITEGTKVKIAKSVVDYADKTRREILKILQVISVIVVHCTIKKHSAIVVYVHISNSEELGCHKVLKYQFSDNTETKLAKALVDRVIGLLTETIPPVKIHLDASILEHVEDRGQYLRVEPVMPVYEAPEKKPSEPKPEKKMNRGPKKHVLARDEKMIEKIRELKPEKINVRYYSVGPYHYVQLWIDAKDHPTFGATKKEDAVKRAFNVITNACPNAVLDIQKDIKHLVPGCQTAGNQ